MQTCDLPHLGPVDPHGAFWAAPGPQVPGHLAMRTPRLPAGGRTRRMRRRDSEHSAAGRHDIPGRRDCHDGSRAAAGRRRGGQRRDDCGGRAAGRHHGAAGRRNPRGRARRPRAAARLHRRARPLPGRGAGSGCTVAPPTAGRRRQHRRRYRPQDHDVDCGTRHRAGRAGPGQRLRRLAPRGAPPSDARRSGSRLDRAPDRTDARLGTPPHGQLRGAGRRRHHRRDARSARRPHSAQGRIAGTGRCPRRAGRQAHRRRTVRDLAGRDGRACPARHRRLSQLRRHHDSGRGDRTGNGGGAAGRRRAGAVRRRRRGIRRIPGAGGRRARSVRAGLPRRVPHGGRQIFPRRLAPGAHGLGYGAVRRRAAGSAARLPCVRHARSAAVQGRRSAAHRARRADSRARQRRCGHRL